MAVELLEGGAMVGMVVSERLSKYLSCLKRKYQNRVLLIKYDLS